MAQHDYNIANQSGADFRADLNNALLAIATVNSGATEPSTTFAHQLWVDTSSSVLKIRNAADNAWITTGVSITASNTFTGDLTGDVTGNLTGNVTGNVTGDLTGNADSADTLSTARTISLSGDVVGSVSFDGSANVDIDTVVQINSITLGTDTTGDYVESMSGGTGVTVTGGTGEGSTPSIAIGQSVATTDNVTFNLVTATDEFVGDLDGAIRFTAKADESLSKGDVVYVSGVSGNTTTVGKAKADDASKMPAFGMAVEDANANNNLQIVTFGNLTSIDTSNESVGEILYVSTTAGEYTTTAPTGESAAIQNIGKILRSHQNNGSIKVGGAGRSNATPNLNDGKIFIGNASNQAVTSTLDTSIVVENTNLYYTTARANTDFDTRLATKDTGDLTEGSNLYYTTARVNSDFDTRLATKSTTDLAEGTNLYYTSARFDSAFTSKDTDDLSEGTTNLYYTSARFDSAFGNKTTADLTENTNLYYTDTRANSAIDARVTKAFVDALNIQAASVDANSVTLGTDTVGNYVQTITGTANKITVSGSGSESADITLSLPDDVQIASDLTVAGNLTVNGTLTSLDTTNLDIEDNLFQLNAGLTGSPVNDSGMLINRGDQDNGIFMWDESVDKFTLGLTTADGSATGNITLNSLGTLVANIEGDVTGAVTGTVSSLSNHDTGDLAEGSNLYYTQARFDSAFTAKSTSDLSEGTNLYYTDARVQAVSINNVVEDTTPQLGGNLDLNSNDITGTGNINITGTIQSSGNITGTLATAAQPNITSLGTLTGLTTTGDINFGDSDKAVFGAGSDLQIYHDTHSYIQDTGTGSLFLLTQGAEISLFGNTSAEYMGRFIQDGAVELYHNGSPKLATTSTGINVTGTATMDGLTVDGNATVQNTGDGFRTLALSGNRTGGGVTTARVSMQWDGNEIARIQSHGGADTTNKDEGDLLFYTADAGSLKLRQLIDQNGDISFYDDTGTSQALYWDASEERLGIGTTSPRGKLDVSSTDDTNGTKVIAEVGSATVSANNNASFSLYELGTEYGRFQRARDGLGTVKLSALGTNSLSTETLGAGKLFFKTNNTERMRIDSSGNVGIGTTSPTTLLQVGGTVRGTASIVGTDGASPYLKLDHTATTSGRSYSIYSGGLAAGNFDIYDNTASAARLSIDSSGNVGIGTSSPAYPLTVDGYIGVRSGNGITFLNPSNNYTSDIYNGASSGTSDLRFKTQATERMIIDSSGNLLHGTTGTSWTNTAGTYLFYQSALNVTRDGAESMNLNRLTSDGDIALFRKDGLTVGSIGSEGGDALYIQSGTTSGAGLHMHPTAGNINPARNGVKVDNVIDLGRSTHRFKDLYLSGRVEANGVTTTAVAWQSTSDSTSSSKHFRFKNPNGNVGDIRTNGSATAYITSSDYRLKENVVAMSGAIERLKQLKPSRFNFIADADTTVDGFLAHEVQDIVPEAIAGEKDAMIDEEYEVTPAVLDDDGNVVTAAVMGTRSVPDYQGIDQSKLVPLLTKAIQEQQTLIESLEARITALES